ncbi:MAG TPA: FecR family protein [Stellaceae bacterium]|nr:FecR family protein [Stellaceae bacterium]
MPHILSRALWAAVFALALLGPARAEAAAGTVVGIAGQCFDESGGQRKPLRLGSPVEVGDVIEVPAAAKLKLRMGDGSIVSVASNTKFTIATYTLDPKGKRQDAELNLGQGLLRAVVAPVDHPSTFEVKTATGTAAVRSTDWFIEAKPNDTLVAVLTGIVSLTSSTTGQSVAIGPRHGAHVALEHDPTTPQLWTMRMFYALNARVEIPVRRPPRRRHSEEEEYHPGPNNPPPSEGPPPSQYTPPPSQNAPPPNASTPPPPSGPGGFGSYPGGVFGNGPGGMGFPTRPGGGGFTPPPPPPPPRNRGNY